MKKIFLLILTFLLLVSCSEKVENKNIKFDEITIDEKIDNGATIVKGKYCKISLFGKISENENLYSNIESLNENFEKYAKDFITDSKNDYLSADEEMKKSFLYTYSKEGNLITENQNVLSILTNTYLETMGAHGMTIIEGYNYDMNNGQRIMLSNIVLDKNSLKNLIIEKLKTDEYKDIFLFDDYETTLDNFFNFSNKNYVLEFNLLDDGIQFIFNQYDLAPYSAGIITVKFTKDEVKNVIIDNYWE